MQDSESAEIADLGDALSLWRLLVTDTLGSRLPPSVAIDAFRRLHGSGEKGAVDSAVLLCTDWRWHSVSAKVIAGIVESGILDDDDQDRLANMLLWQQPLQYRHPLWWIGTSFVEYDPESRRLGRPGRVDPNTPVVARRHVWPPLRNWASGRLLSRNLVSAGDILERARSLPAPDAAAVVTGAVHAIDALDDDQARTMLDAALAWGHKTPRKAAMERLLADGENERVGRIARDDPDASIRRWAAKQLSENGSQGSLFG